MITLDKGANKDLDFVHGHIKWVVQCFLEDNESNAGKIFNCTLYMWPEKSRYGDTEVVDIYIKGYTLENIIS